MLEIQHNESDKKFEAIYNGRNAGLMTYTWAGNDKFIIDHTEVDEAYNGKGIGKELVLASVEFARKNDKKIIPLCPFAKATFQRNVDLNDVLA